MYRYVLILIISRRINYKYIMATISFMGVIVIFRLCKMEENYLMFTLI